MGIGRRGGGGGGVTSGSRATLPRAINEHSEEMTIQKERDRRGEGGGLIPFKDTGFLISL